MKRHDAIAVAIAGALNRIEGIRASAVTQPRVDGSTQRRSDVRICRSDGMQWLLDVTVTNVGLAGMVLRHNSHKVPGAVAEAASKRKQDKYKDVENFVPFALETGGRICLAGSTFVDRITNPPDSAAASGPGPTPKSLQKARAVFVAAMRTLVSFQATMLTRLEAALLRPDAAAHSSVHGPALPLPGDAVDSGPSPE